MYLLSDNNDTRTGLRLVGIEGETILYREGWEEKLKDALNRVLQDKEIGILIINEELAKNSREIIDDIKLNRKQPLVVEIPDRHGTGRQADFISAYIREAIGVKI